MENDYVNCAGQNGTACEFTVVSEAQGGSAIKLRNVAQLHFYLAIFNGYFVGHVSIVHIIAFVCWFGKYFVAGPLIKY